MTTEASNICPACGAAIAIDDINIQEGVGLCRACGRLSRLADMVEACEWAGVSEEPPAGCRLDDDGARIAVRASARTVGGMLGVLAICLFWNGIVSVFLLVAIGGLYTHLVGPLPAWFPAPSGQGSPGGAGSGSNGFQTLGETLFLCVFLTPFVLVGLALIGGLVFAAAGEVRVQLDGAAGSVWTGVKFIGWTQRFDASAVTRVTIGNASWPKNDQVQKNIEIHADRRVKFGSGLPEARRLWMTMVLRTLLLGQRSGAAR
ncbi:MAG: hypothetical protein NTW19_07370 [Planctomycetota bacterium]|nr:hypothetical protein [Planctomycetota bacterium]